MRVNLRPNQVVRHQQLPTRSRMIFSVHCVLGCVGYFNLSRFDFRTVGMEKFEWHNVHTTYATSMSTLQRIYISAISELVGLITSPGPNSSAIKGEESTPELTIPFVVDRYCPSASQKKSSHRE